MIGRKRRVSNGVTDLVVKFTLFNNCLLADEFSFEELPKLLNLPCLIIYCLLVDEFSFEELHMSIVDRICTEQLPSVV